MDQKEDGPIKKVLQALNYKQLQLQQIESFKVLIPRLLCKVGIEMLSNCHFVWPDFQNGQGRWSKRVKPDPRFLRILGLIL